MGGMESSCHGVIHPFRDYSGMQSRWPGLHPSVDIRKKYDFLHDIGEQGFPVHTKNLQNGLETARHGLILRQHKATAYTELLETYFRSYRSIFNPFLTQMIDFPGTRVWGVENHTKKQKILTLGWSEVYTST